MLFNDWSEFVPAVGFGDVCDGDCFEEFGWLGYSAKVVRKADVSFFEKILILEIIFYLCFGCAYEVSANVHEIEV